MISERDGQIFIEGAMNQATAAALLPEGEALMVTADRVLNLSGIDAVDSSAVALLLAWLRAAMAAGKTLSVVQAPATFVSLASLYGVSEMLFPVETTDRENSVQH